MESVSLIELLVWFLSHDEALNDTGSSLCMSPALPTSLVGTLRKLSYFYHWGPLGLALQGRAEYFTDGVGIAGRLRIKAHSVLRVYLVWYNTELISDIGLCLCRPPFSSSARGQAGPSYWGSGGHLPFQCDKLVSY